MATPVGFADCSVFLSLAGDPEEMAITFGVETDLASFSQDDHAAKVFGATAGAFENILSDEYTFTRAVLRFGQDGGEDTVAEFGTSPVPGDDEGEKLPQNCALLIRKNTNLGGRRNRGRAFIPGVLTESAVNQVGALNASMLNSGQTAATAWFENLQDTNGGLEPSTPMVILHSDGGAPTPVSSLAVDGRIATQRRRLRR